MPAAERRAAILQAAIDCFSAKGFRGTTTRELARRAGITEAALYRYFPSKRALYEAIVDAKIAAGDPLREVEQAAARADDRALFEGLARVLLRRGRSDPAFLRILLFTALEGHALAEPFFRARMRGLRDFLAAYIERRRAEGAFRAIDARLAAHAYLGMIFDHLIVREIFAQREIYSQPVEEVAAVFADLFLEGLRMREASDG